MRKRRLPVGVYDLGGASGPLYFFGLQVGAKWIRRPSPDGTVSGAVKAREEALARVRRGEPAILERLPGHGPMTVGRIVTRHVEILRRSKRSATALALIVRRGKMLDANLGTALVADLDESALLAYRERREANWKARQGQRKAKKGQSARPLRVATVNRELEFLRGALNGAKEAGLITTHVFDRLSKAARRRVIPEEIADGPREFRGVGDSELDRMLTELPEVYRKPVRALFLTGAREAEIFELPRDQVLPDVIRFTRTKGREVRDFPLTEELRELIGEGDDGLVFPGPDGRSLLPAFGKAWQRARKRAGLPWIKPHHLRGERASRFSEDGASETEIRVLLGWSDHSPVPVRYIRASKLRLHALAAKTSARRDTGGRVLRFEAGESGKESVNESAGGS